MQEAVTFFRFVPSAVLRYSSDCDGKTKQPFRAVMYMSDDKLLILILMELVHKGGYGDAVFEILLAQHLSV